MAAGGFSHGRGLFGAPGCWARALAPRPPETDLGADPWQATLGASNVDPAQPFGSLGSAFFLNMYIIFICSSSAPNLKMIQIGTINQQQA